jgi:hypothetical protein
MRKLQIAPHTQSLAEVYTGSVRSLMAFFPSSKAWPEMVAFLPSLQILFLRKFDKSQLKRPLLSSARAERSGGGYLAEKIHAVKFRILL